MLADEIEEATFELDEISEADLRRVQHEEATAIRRSLLATCERLLNKSKSEAEAEAEKTLLTEAQQDVIAKCIASNHRSARRSAVAKIDAVVDRAATLSVAEFRFCLNGALDCYAKTYVPEADLVRQLAVVFDDETPDLASGLGDIWESYGAGEMREAMKREAYVRAGL